MILKQLFLGGKNDIVLLELVLQSSHVEKGGCDADEIFRPHIKIQVGYYFD